MKRISKKDLDMRVAYLNRLTGNPTEAHTWENGAYRSNDGAYVLSGAYGGWALDQIVGDRGGARNISPRMGKRELYDWINAYIAGYEEARK